MQSNKRSNSGFSLIEVLVVVAIMGVLMGGTLITYYTVRSNNVKKSAGYISDAMTECRNRAMTTQAKTWEVVITKETVQVIKVDSNDVEHLITSNDLPSHVAVTLTDSETLNVIDLFSESTTYDSVVITYKLLSGEINKVIATSDAGEVVIYDGTQTSKYCDIKCDYKNKKSRSLRLYYSTGKNITLD